MKKNNDNAFVVLVALGIAAGYFFGVMKVHRIWLRPPRQMLDCKPGTHEVREFADDPDTGHCVTNPPMPPPEDQAPSSSDSQDQ